MADIFLSYKREDLERARPLVALLEDCGWTLFWDPEILSGEVWNAALERELDAAGCVVVLWSDRSVESEWVLREARSGSAREVLLPALLDRVEPPGEFRHLQSTDLVGWNGEAGGHAIETFVRAVTELIGRRLLPVDLNLITGDRERWQELGPTVNMGCRLTNVGRLPLALNRLELDVSREGQPIYELAWRLFYSAAGLEHVKDPYEEQIAIAGNAVWQRGVQFRSMLDDLPNVWQPGSYEFELLGWINCRHRESRANVRTRFRANVDPWTSSEMAMWRGASVEKWNDRDASNRSLGFPLQILDLEINPSRGS